jgi:hypothetical protein
MSDTAEAYAIFNQPGHLIEALVAARGAYVTAFPENVLVVRSHRLAVPLRLVDSPHFTGLRAERGWQVEVKAAAPQGKTQPFTAILDYAWQYCDPARPEALPDGTFMAPPALGRDGERPVFTYLLAATNRQGSQRILDTLTQLLARDLRGAPVQLAGAAETGTWPYTFLWRVDLARPCLLVLRAAERCWWGPLDRGRVQIFLEWPYRLSLPPECLPLLPWGISEGCVLLSRQKPRTVTLAQPLGQPIFGNLIKVAELTVAEASQVKAEVAASPQPLQLEVQVRLVPGDPQQADKRRGDDLEQEIAAKEALLKNLRKRTARYAETDMPREPLLVFFEPAGGGLPNDLRRLLIEWSDQANDLRALYYQALPGQVWPARPGQPLTCARLHLLTTGQALGRGGPVDLGVRLREYRPQLRDGEAFELLSEWLPQLRLFVPRGQRTELYPALPTSQMAAEKLDQALLGGQSSHQVAVLVARQEGHIHALRLERGAFQPFNDAFQWDCRLSLTPSQAESVTAAAGHAGKALADKVAARMVDELDAAAAVVVQAALVGEEKRLADELKRLTDELKRHEAQVQQLQKQLAKYQELLDGLAPLDQQAARRAGVVLTSVTRVRAEVQQAQDSLKALDSVTAELDRMQATNAATTNELLGRRQWLARLRRR